MFLAFRSFFDEESDATKRGGGGAVVGAVIGWVLIVLTVVAGDWRQLALAGALSVIGLVGLGLFHRWAIGQVKTSRQPGRPTTPTLQASAALADELDCWLSPGTGEGAHLDLTDLEWAVVAPMLPRPSHGAGRIDERSIVNGVLWRLRTGAPWTEIPARYGSHKVCAARFNQWRREGVWRRVLEAVNRIYEGDVEMIDSAARVSAGQAVRRPALVAERAVPEPAGSVAAPEQARAA